MSITNDIISCFKKVHNFSGRACRREFWTFQIFWVIAYILVYWLTSGFLRKDHVVDNPWIVTTFFFLPLLTVSFRRLHDVNLPGWVLFAPFLLFCTISLVDSYDHISVRIFQTIAFFGAIGLNAWIVVKFFTKGDEGENFYGEQPAA